MNSPPVFFNEALKRASVVANNPLLSAAGIAVLLVRDIYGRIRVAIDKPKKECPPDIVAILLQQITELGAFNGGLLFQDELFDSDQIFKNPDIVEVYLPDADTSVRILDRQIVGQDWLRPHEDVLVNHNKAPRLVFYGIKGGVGRSTALAILAYDLARKGKRVLLFDFDLESPGLSSLLLPPDRLAEFGLVDWFIEDAVGQGDEVIERMISRSPLAEQTQGDIRIAAAMGMDEQSYLAKLSRVYADVIHNGEAKPFWQRMYQLVTTLEAHEKPDVVLIDSRAGLHDLAAINIVGLADHVFMFATDTAQSWQGYRLLFTHWQSHPAVLEKIRDRLVVVDALFPEENQLERAEHFLDRSYTLFSETLYERIEPNTPPNSDIFNFDLKDSSAPHAPLRIRWNKRFQEFDLALLDLGILSEADITSVYGDFLQGAYRLISSEET